VIAKSQRCRRRDPFARSYRQGRTRIDLRSRKWDAMKVLREITSSQKFQYLRCVPNCEDRNLTASHPISLLTHPRSVSIAKSKLRPIYPTIPSDIPDVESDTCERGTDGNYDQVVTGVTLACCPLTRENGKFPKLIAPGGPRGHVTKARAGIRSGDILH
jgi:hypothetical protein